MDEYEGRPIRFALVGVGRIGLTHLDALAMIDGAQLTALVEPREAVAAPLAEQRGVRWFADPTDPALLDNIDAAVLCTPPDTHVGIGTYLMSHGKHVLCEKPLALRTADARTLIEAARAAGRQLMMASKFRYATDVIKAKATIEAGSLGRIVAYENAFWGAVPMKDRWNAVRAVAGGGVIMDNGTHSVNIARYLFGPIVDVQAQAGTAVQGLEVEDTARLQFRTAGGVVGLVNLTWSANRDADAYLTVYGTEGTLVVGWKGSRAKLAGSAEWTPFGTGWDKVGTLRKQAQNFADVLRGRAAPLITSDDALASVQVIEAAYASLDRNLWQRVGG